MTAARAEWEVGEAPRWVRVGSAPPGSWDEAAVAGRPVTTRLLGARRAVRRSVERWAARLVAERQRLDAAAGAPCAARVSTAAAAWASSAAPPRSVVVVAAAQNDQASPWRPVQVPVPVRAVVAPRRPPPAGQAVRVVLALLAAAPRSTPRTRPPQGNVPQRPVRRSAPVPAVPRQTAEAAPRRPSAAPPRTRRIRARRAVPVRCPPAIPRRCPPVRLAGVS